MIASEYQAAATPFKARGEHLTGTKGRRGELALRCASSLSRRTVELIKLVSARLTEFLQGILDVQKGPLRISSAVKFWRL